MGGPEKDRWWGEAQISLEVQALEGQLADQQLGALLVEEGSGACMYG